MRVDAITNIDSFKEASGDWDLLYAESVDRFPMISSDWLSAWWDSFGDNAKMHIVAIWDENKLVFAAPLFFKQVNLLRMKRSALGFISNERVDRMQFLFHKDYFENPQTRNLIFDCFFRHLKREAPAWSILTLKNMDSGSDVTNSFSTYLGNHNFAYGIDKGLTSPRLQMPDTWGDLMNGLSSSFRQSVRRKIRKTEKNYNIKYVIYRDASFLAPLAAIDKKTWQHDAGTAMFTKDHVGEFYKKIINSAEAKNTLYSAIIEVDGKPIAYEFNLLCDSTLHNFKLGYDKDYSDISAGILLKSHIFQCLLDGDRKLNIKEYDFMGDNASYKLNWAKDTREHITINVYGNSLLPRIHAVLKYKVKPHVKKLHSRIKKGIAK